MQLLWPTKTIDKGGSVMIEQCVLYFCGLTPLGMHLYRLVGAFPDCEPVLVVNNVDPVLLRNPSLLKYEVVRRGYQVPNGGIGIGKRTDWQGEMVDGYEVLSVLSKLTDVEVKVHPDIAAVQSLFAGSSDLKAPESSDKVVVSQAPEREEKGNELNDNVHSAELSVGKQEGDGAANAGGDKPRPIQTRKGSVR